LAATYRKNDDVVARQIAGETLLVPIRGELAGLQRVFALDGVGEYVWQQLDAGVTEETLVSQVVAQFDVDREEAEADIRQFVHELLAAGLVVEES
jgi:hypothetical protein